MTESGTAHYDFTGFRILLVEDNDINRELASEYLRYTGAEVYLADNGGKAVEMIISGATRYDLVLMDIQMPVMDGFEATRQIRSDSRYDNMPILAMTAHATYGDSQKILQAGMNAHIIKPINVKKMYELILTFLSHDNVRFEKGQFPVDSDFSASESGTVNGFDLVAALDRLDGNNTLFKRLLRRFAEKNSRTPASLTEELRSGNVENAYRIAHTVKSSSGTIGAVDLMNLAGLLETAIGNRVASEQTQELLARFTTELERVVGELPEIESRY